MIEREGRRHSHHTHRTPNAAKPVGVIGLKGNLARKGIVNPRACRRGHGLPVRRDLLNVKQDAFEAAGKTAPTAKATCIVIRNEGPRRWPGCAKCWRKQRALSRSGRAKKSRPDTRRPFLLVRHAVFLRSGQSWSEAAQWRPDALLRRANDHV